MRSVNSAFSMVTASGIVYPVPLSSPEKNIPNGDAIRSPIRQMTNTIERTVLPPAIIAAARLLAADRITRSARPAAWDAFCAVACAAFAAC